MRLPLALLATLVCLTFVIRRRGIQRAEIAAPFTSAMRRQIDAAIAVEACVAGLIMLHLFGYLMSGWQVLIVLGVVGNLGPMLWSLGRRGVSS